MSEAAASLIFLVWAIEFTAERRFTAEVPEDTQIRVWRLPQSIC